MLSKILKIVILTSASFKMSFHCLCYILYKVRLWFYMKTSLLPKCFLESNQNIHSQDISKAAIQETENMFRVSVYM